MKTAQVRLSADLNRLKDLKGNTLADLRYAASSTEFRYFLVRAINSHAELLEALRRAEHLLDAARRFINSNPIEEYTVNYDEATCDGARLADDCKIAADEIRVAIAKAERGE